MFSLCFPEIVRPSLSFYLSSQCILIMTKMRAQVKEKKKKAAWFVSAQNFFQLEIFCQNYTSLNDNKMFLMKYYQAKLTLVLRRLTSKSLQTTLPIGEVNETEVCLGMVVLRQHQHYNIFYKKTLCSLKANGIVYEDLG